MTTIAFLGTGIMGAPMARHLAAAGFQVRVWNRTRSKAEPLAEHGVEVVDSPRTAATGADLLVTMLIDGPAVLQTVSDGEVMEALADDAVWLQMSTVGLAAIDQLATLAAEHGIGFVDAPVLGTRQPAENGELTVLAAGPEQLRERAQPVFDAVGSSTRWLGPVGSGTRLKLVVNSWVLALTTATAEAVGLAEGLGVDPKGFFDTIAGGPLDAGYAHVKGGAMTAREFPPAFPLAGAVKDAGLINDAARSAGVNLRMAAAVREQMAAAADEGHGDEDMAAVWHAVTARDA